MPYPDDLDDTFCAVSSLYQYNRRLINGRGMAKIIQLLIATEVTEGGPYRTWLINDKAGREWMDIDLAVNSNIAYFLSLQDIQLDNINTFVESRITKEKFHSPYYPNEYPVIYFISRFYKGRKVNKIVTYLLEKQKRDGSWGGSLQTALSIWALLNFGISPASIKTSVMYLVERQVNGSWEPFGFCIDPARKGKTYYAGSAGLTTAFCAGVISQYLFMSHSTDEKHVHMIKGRRETFYRKIIRLVKKDFQKLDSELGKEANVQLQKLIKRDSDKQIVLLPIFLNWQLVKKQKIYHRLL